MNNNALLGLVNNAALLLALGVLYDVVLPRQRPETPWMKALLGLFVGAIGLAVMLNPWGYTSDIVFDTRSILISVSGLFFGPIPTIVAAAILSLFRLYHRGGAGAIAGVSVIIASAGLGLTWRQLRQRRNTPLGWRELYVFGVTVHITMLVCMLTLGWSAAAKVLSHISLPVMIIYPVATVLLGGLLLHQRTRRQVQEALRRERNLLDRITRTGPIGIIVIDRNGLITLANAFAEKLLGMTRDEIRRRTHNAPEWKTTDLEGNAVPEDQFPFAQVVASNGPVFDLQYSIEQPNGRRVLLSVSAAPLHDEFDRVDGVVATLQDITERKRAEERIRRLNRVYAVLSNINQTIVRVREPQALFDEACGIAIRDGGFRLAWLVTLDDHTQESRIAAHAGEGADFLKDLRFSLKDEPLGRGPTGTALREGSHVIVNDISRDERMKPWRQKALDKGFRSAAAFPLKVAGRVRGALSLYAGEVSFFDEHEVRLLDELAMDLSFAMEFAQQEQERQRTETRLLESEARYRSLFENNHAVMLLVDPGSSRIVDANPAACAYYGWTREELAARRIDEINVLTSEQITAEMGLARSEKRNHFLFKHRLADGGVRDVEVYSGPIEFGGKRLLYSIVHDISQRVRAEQDRDRAEADLRQAQKMEAVGRLAGGVAHDFNNMLTVILGYADSMQRQLERQDPLGQAVQEIRNAAQRSADLTRQLLAFSRKQIVKLAVVNLNDQLASQQQLLARLIGEDIKINLMPARDLWNIRIDPSQVDQILANLAVNARDAIADAGAITIETANVTLDETHSRRNLHVSPGDYVMLAFTDTGAGMDTATLEHIFEPFFTTKGEGRGTGLGLSTVYGIVKQNSGVIHAYSEPGMGTTFKIYIPRFCGEAACPSQDDAAASVDGHEVVLIVEDEEQILRIAKAVLEQHGYSVLTATSPAEACMIAESHASAIDLLLTDVVLPGMNGKQLQARMEQLKPGVKTLFMSGYTANVIAHRGVLDEGVDFLQKPFSLEALARKVRAILDGQRQGASRQGG